MILKFNTECISFENVLKSWYVPHLLQAFGALILVPSAVGFWPQTDRCTGRSNYHTPVGIAFRSSRIPQQKKCGTVVSKANDVMVPLTSYIQQVYIPTHPVQAGCCHCDADVYSVQAAQQALINVATQDWMEMSLRNWIDNQADNSWATLRHKIGQRKAYARGRPGFFTGGKTEGPKIEAELPKVHG